METTRRARRSSFILHPSSLVIPPFLLIVLAIAACPPKHERLMQSVSDFNNNIRWKRFEAAGGYMPPALRAAFVEHLEKDEEKINFTDYEVKEVVMDDEEQHAVVRVSLKWFIINEGVEKKAQVIQKWDLVESNWVMASMEGEGPWKPEALKPKDFFGTDGGTVAATDAESDASADAGAGDDK
jgi:hypothetical protein